MVTAELTEATDQAEKAFNWVESAVQRVFSTMLSMQVRLESGAVMTPSDEVHIAGSVGFTGQLTGVIYLYCCNTFARRITGKLLGLEELDIDGDEMVNDAIGELSNMVVGQVKTKLCDSGVPCVLSIPSIVRGRNFSIAPVSSTRTRVFVFQCDEHQLLVEFIIRPVARSVVTLLP
jgi:chemotaxis protein CheX